MARWGRCAAVAVLAAVAAAGCAGGAGEPASSPSQPGPSPLPTVASPSPAPSTTPSQAPWTTSSPVGPTPTSAATEPEVPIVLAGQFTAFIGAGAPGDCDDSLWDVPLAVTPYVGLPEQRVDAVLGGVEPLCLVGFDLDRPIGLALATPDGAVLTMDVWLTGSGAPVDLLAGAAEVVGFGTAHDTGTEGSVDWWIRPDAPVGEYGLVAVQDPLSAVASVWVAPGTRPSLEPLPTDDLAWRRLAVSGFPPGPAAFGIYRDTHVTGAEVDGGTVFELVEDLGVREVDGSGAAVLDVLVADLAPGEWYCVDSPTLADRCDGGQGYVDPEYVPWG